MARPKRQEERRAALIEATYAAGKEHGLRSLSLTDVATTAGLTRGAILYYYEDLDALLVEAHAAGIQRFCNERDAVLAAIDDPRDRLGAAIDAGLPEGPDDALMSLLYEFDVLAGNSALHDELVQKLYLRQLETYRGVIAAGRAAEVFSPGIDDEQLAMTFVALEDAYGLHIVGGNALMTVRRLPQRCARWRSSWGARRSPEHGTAHIRPGRFHRRHPAGICMHMHLFTPVYPDEGVRSTPFERHSVSTPVIDRTAPTEHPVLDVLAGRWSPRAFDAQNSIDEAKLATALEAARWSPSANNSQPWRFIVARRGTALHAQVVDALMGFNQAWAGNAAVLVVAIAETADASGTPITHALYDLGQAVAHFSVQAHHDGLVVHQMSGFDPEVVREFADLEERFVPFTVFAVGEFGDIEALPEVLQEREVAPRVRRPIAETVILSA